MQPQPCPACCYAISKPSEAVAEDEPGPDGYALCPSCGEVLEYAPVGPFSAVARLVIAHWPFQLDLGELISLRKQQRLIRERGPL